MKYQVMTLSQSNGPGRTHVYALRTMKSGRDLRGGGYPQLAWRRLRVHDLSVGELEWWGPDDYTNPHAR